MKRKLIKGQIIMVRPPYEKQEKQFEVIKDFEGSPKYNLDCLKEILVEQKLAPSPVISKRFYAACAAMQGLISCEFPESILIETAYKYADKLLKQE